MTVRNIIILMFALLLPICIYTVATAQEVESTEVKPSITTPADCPFHPGWNLSVLSGTTEDLPDCISVVWRFEGTEDRWYFWGRDNSPLFNDLGEFDITKSYWLYRD